MLQQDYVLPGKIKIGQESNKTDATKHLSFYTSYSHFILKALKKSSFQEFLWFMLLTENIEQRNVSSVEIKVLPAPRKNGYNIVGKCNVSRGNISIYPKTFNYCFSLRKKYGKKYVFAFVGNRARAALMHELLHLKYVSDEKKVRELTDGYFSEYIKKQSNKNANLRSLHDLIFSSKKQIPFLTK
jgi:hypothetical protein